VGQRALEFIIPTIAEGILEREHLHPGTLPPDIIIAENVRGGAEIIESGLRHAFEHKVAPELVPNLIPGLVETSIGKMVPIMTAADKARDPLRIFAEPYNTLIVDAKGFRGSLPDFPQIKAVSNIKAYVDRKLFIHNLGHAAAAYLGHRHNPSLTYLWEAIETPEVAERVRRGMTESAAALRKEYSRDFDDVDLADHIEDLLSRFANRALGDTIFRVGRDVRRKLGREDRVIGAARLCESHRLPYRVIAAVFDAALHFHATDEEGVPFPADIEFLDEIGTMTAQEVLTGPCGLSADDPVDLQVIRRLSARSYTK
jgi:mannitol-1-phosphate 5-dehydrogenase